MIKGQSRIHGTLKAFLWIGLSHQNLYFKGDGSETEHKQLESQTPLGSFRCSECRALLLPFQPPGKRSTLLSEP